jgi:exopolysaccharide biosynthesis protein
MTSDELAEVMLGLGAHDALSLDGRGASTMVVNEEAVSHTDGRAQRRVSSGLLIVKRRRW